MALAHCLIGGLFLIVIMGGAVLGKTTLGLDSGITFRPTGTLLDLDSSFLGFQVGHYAGDVALLSDRFLRTLFLTDGTLTEKGSAAQAVIQFPMYPADRRGAFQFSFYHKEDLVIDWPVGTWSVISDVAFSTFTSELSRWWSTVNVSAYGTSTTATFLLMPTPLGTAAGLSVELSGPTLTGMGVTISADFGMPTAFGGIGGVVPTASCELRFREANLGFEGVVLGCVALDVETTIGCHGYESTEIGFDLDLPIDWVTVEGILEFATKTKSITLIPRVHMEPTCIWVNIGLDPATWKENALLDALIVRGVGISDETIGSSQFSAIASFIGGVYRDVSKDDIELHAGDYYVALDPEADASKYVFLPYDIILSIEHGEANSDLVIDAYFGSPEPDLFDLALVTAEWNYQLSTELDLFVRVALDPNGVLTKFVFGFEASVFLP